MYTGSLAPFSNNEDWIIQSPLIDDDGSEIDLTSATFEFYLTTQACPTTAVLTGTLDSGNITLPTTTSFKIWFTPDEVSAIDAGTYDVFLRVTIDDITTQILAADVQVIEGGP